MPVYVLATVVVYLIVELGVSKVFSVVVHIPKANVGVVVLGESRGASGLGMQKALGTEKPSGYCSFKTS